MSGGLIDQLSNAHSMGISGDDDSFGQGEIREISSHSGMEMGESWRWRWERRQCRPCMPCRKCRWWSYRAGNDLINQVERRVDAWMRLGYMID